MTRTPRLRASALSTSALAAAGLVALAALSGCNKSTTANGDSGAQSTADSDQGGPNGYAPTGGQAEATPATQGVTSGPAVHRRHGRGGEAGGEYEGGSDEGGGYQNAGYYVDAAPPPIPQYDQPPPPGDGYYWTPGYWAWSRSDSDYYWVPGTWVQPPRPSDYWTPGYWSYVNGGYAYYPGYWGPTVGYYGGVDYGWGYNGRGYYGGRWQGDHFAYNSAVNNISSVHVANVYRQDTTNWTNNRTSYSGGPHGLRVAPTPEQISAARAPHLAPTPVQVQHRDLAQQTPGLRASANNGRPTVVATSRPTAFTGPGVVTQVKSEPHYTPPAHIQAAAQPPQQARPSEARQPEARTPEPAPQGHGGPPPAAVEPPREAQHTAGAPAGREAGPPTALGHGGGPPAAQHGATRPEAAAPPTRAQEYKPQAAPHAAEVRPPEHAAPPPHSAPPEHAVEHSAPPPRPMERAAPPPQQHSAPPPRPEARPAPPPPHAQPQEKRPEDRPKG